MENRHCVFFGVNLKKYFDFFFQRKTKCLVKPIKKTKYSTLVPSNGAKNLIGLQAHNGDVTNQGRSHRD